MPVSQSEWEEFTEVEDEPVGDTEEEKDSLAVTLVLTFLTRNGENAYTETEIVNQVTFGQQPTEEEENESLSDRLRQIPTQAITASENLVARTVVSIKIETALEHLMESGFVECRKNPKNSTRYYKLSSLQPDKTEDLSERYEPD